MIKDFVNLTDFTAGQLDGLVRRAIADKALLGRGELPAALGGKTLAMIFEKPSLRTRVSFETAMAQLGGHAIYLAPADIGLGTREPVCDVARVLGRICDGIMARTFLHETVEQLAEHCPAPVINALSDYSHPCQAMADLMTVMEHFCSDRSSPAGRTLVFVGDGNNVARSLAVLCAKLDLTFVLSAPEGYELEDAFVQSLPDGGQYILNRDPTQAVADADVIYTDTWVSMGQEEQKAERIKDFAGFQVDSALLAAAPDHAIVLHCLPAYRGIEIAEDVFEAHARTIFEQAENRLHVQRTLLNVLLGEGGIE